MQLINAQLLAVALVFTGMTQFNSLTQKSSARTETGAAYLNQGRSSLDGRSVKSDFTRDKRCFSHVNAMMKDYGFLQSCKANAKTSLSAQACSKQRVKRESALRTSRDAISRESCMADLRLAERKYALSTIKAASAGIHDAEMCYVKGSFDLSPPQLSEYPARARLYVEAALDRGLWRVVELLTLSKESIAHGGGGLFGTLNGVGTDLTVYRATKLLQIGAAGEYRGSLANALKIEASQLTIEQVKNADRWAQDEYINHFATSPKLSQAPVVCDD